MNTAPLAIDIYVDAASSYGSCGPHEAGTIRQAGQSIKHVNVI